jgi:hypothetical protein
MPVVERAVETEQDRMELSSDAGYGAVSGVSALAGALCAVGLFALVVAIGAAVLRQAGVHTDYVASEWRRLGAGAGLAAAMVLFATCTFGGYVAGRMARRAGTANGIAVCFMAVILAAICGFAAANVVDTHTVGSELRGLGIPTTWGTWRDVAWGVGLAGLIAMIAGCVIGANAGEHWHTKLLTRAADPMVGPAAVEAPAETTVNRSRSRRQSSPA